MKGCYECIMCGYVYVPEEGDWDTDVVPGTPFSEIPEDWFCPDCGATKEWFEEMPEKDW